MDEGNYGIRTFFEGVFPWHLSENTVMSKKQIHFILTFLIILCTVFLQSYVIARIDSPWLRPDLITILVIYFAIEHSLYSALFKIFVGAYFFETMSAAPQGFFFMYFLIALVVSNAVSRYIVLHKMQNQVLLFAAVFLLKYVLFYFVFSADGQSPLMFDFIEFLLPGLIISSIVAVPVFLLMSQFDEKFEVGSPKRNNNDAAYI